MAVFACTGKGRWPTTPRSAAQGDRGHWQSKPRYLVYPFAAANNRCQERGFLEYHHQEPYGKDGMNEASNICLMCQSHNAYAADKDYGEEWMKRKVAPPAPDGQLAPGRVTGALRDSLPVVKLFEAMAASTSHG